MGRGITRIIKALYHKDSDNAMKLQIGSSEVRGIYKGADWINLDIVRQDGVNVIGSGVCLPFADSSIDEIHCIHVLEHVTRDKYPIMLKEMYRVLKPGASCFVETPDFKCTIDNLQGAFKRNDRHAIHVWTTSIYGKNERAGMAHHWGFFEGLLHLAMIDAGFLRPERSRDYISSHYKQEPILLMKATK